MPLTKNASLKYFGETDSLMNFTDMDFRLNNADRIILLCQIVFIFYYFDF